MFTRYLCLSLSLSNKNEKINNSDSYSDSYSDLKISLDKSHHFNHLKDGITCIMDIIKQKIEHYVVLNEKELKYIKELNKEDIYDIILLYNNNNGKF
jgi:predicted transcriptional regulator